MKKILFTLLGCFMISLTAYAQEVTRASSTQNQKGKIFLQSNGKVKGIFESNALQAAIDEATPEGGDIIYLSSGFFDGDAIIDKPISIIGVGADNSLDSYTAYGGSLSCNDSSSSKLIDKVLIEGVRFTNSNGHYLKGINSLVLRKCYFSYFLYLGNSGGSNSVSTIKNVVLDRCQFRYYVNVASDVESLFAKNCKLNSVEGSNTFNENIRFNHCNISSPRLSAVYSNSILGDISSLNSGAMLVNTLYKNLSSESSSESSINFQDCKGVDEDLISTGSYYDDDVTLDCVYTAEQLKQNNYLGYDGTVYGVEGGVNPFSLKRHVPVFTTKSLSIDPIKKELSADIKVTAN